MALASSVSLIRTGGGTVAGRRAPTPPAASLAARRRTVLRCTPKAAPISVSSARSVADRLAMARSRPTLSAASKKQIAAAPTKIPTCLPNRRITTREPIGIPSGGTAGRPAPSFSPVSTTGTRYISTQFQSIINVDIHQNLTQQLLTDGWVCLLSGPKPNPLHATRSPPAEGSRPGLSLAAGSRCRWTPRPQASGSGARPRGDVPCLSEVSRPLDSRVRGQGPWKRGRLRLPGEGCPSGFKHGQSTGWGPGRHRDRRQSHVGHATGVGFNRLEVLARLRPALGEVCRVRGPAHSI